MTCEITSKARETTLSDKKSSSCTRKITLSSKMTNKSAKWPTMATLYLCKQNQAKSHTESHESTNTMVKKNQQAAKEVLVLKQNKLWAKLI